MRVDVGGGYGGNAGGEGRIGRQEKTKVAVIGTKTTKGKLHCARKNRGRRRRR